MPNHETNNVVILGEPAKIRAFVNEAFTHPGQPLAGDPEETNEKDIPVLDFYRIAPQPENIEKGGCSGEHEEGVVCWHKWNRENWGTKWGAYNHSHYELRWFKRYAPQDEPREIFGRVDLRFETARSQPTPIFEKIEERWGVTVHAVTQDEGGFDDIEYGDPYDYEVLRKVVTYEFDSWHDEVDEPVVLAITETKE